MPTDSDADLTTAATAARKQNMQLGLSLFALYTALYGAFVLTSAFYPDVMEIRPGGGLNLALLWGFGLIVVAILLSFVYGMFSRVAGAKQ